MELEYNNDNNGGAARLHLHLRPRKQNWEGKFWVGNYQAGENTFISLGHPPGHRSSEKMCLHVDQAGPGK